MHAVFLKFLPRVLRLSLLRSFFFHQIHVIFSRRHIHPRYINIILCYRVSVCVCVWGGVTQSVERATPGEEVPGSIPAVTA